MWNGVEELCFPRLQRNLPLFRVIIVIVYFTQMTEAKEVMPRRYWVVLPSLRQVPFSEVGALLAGKEVSGASQKDMAPPCPA